MGADPTELVSLSIRAPFLPHEEDKARKSPTERQEGPTVRTPCRPPDLGLPAFKP